MSEPATAMPPEPARAALAGVVPAGAAEETGPPPGSHRLSSRVEGLSCPNCGGALEVDAGLRVVTCGYCATPLLALSEVGIRRFAVRPVIDAEEARSRARGWLGKGFNKDSRLRREAKVGEAFLCFLPFYRVEADAVGFALGTEQRRRVVGSGKNRRVETYEVDVERKVERSFDRTYPAVNVAEWGIRKVDLRGDPLTPFAARELERQGMVFPPTGSELVVRDAALERFRQEAEPSSGLKRTRFRFLETLRERLSVVYYPLWVVRYRFRERSYQALVDAEDGSLAYGKAPGNDLYRALMLVGTQAVALYLGTTLIQAFGSLEAMAVVGLGVAAFVFWGWRRFRYGGVVIEGSGTTGGPELGDALRSLSSADGRRRALQELAAGRLPGQGR